MAGTIKSILLSVFFLTIGISQSTAPLYAATCVGPGHTYEYVGDLDQPYKSPAKLAMGPNGDLYVLNFAGALNIYRKGLLINSIPITGPNGVAVSPSGEVFVSTNGKTIDAYTIYEDGTFTKRFFAQVGIVINDLAIAADGKVHATYGTGRWYIFEADGTLLGRFGAGELYSAPGITLDEANRRIIITDSSAFNLKIYHMDTLEFIGTAGQNRYGHEYEDGLFFDRLRGVTTDKEGRIIIADTNAIYIADACLDYIDRIGGYWIYHNNGEWELFQGRSNGHFYKVVDVAVDNDNGLIYGSDLDGRIAVFRAQPTVKRTVVGKGTNLEDQVEIYDADGVNENSFSPYGAAGSTHVASGDIDGDGTDEILSVPGASNPSVAELKVFSRTGVEKTNLRILPFGPDATDMGVASADFDNDGKAEVILWSGGSGQPLQMKVYTYDAVASALVTTGIDVVKNPGDSLLDVAAGDMNGNGFAELVTMTGTMVDGLPERNWIWDMWAVDRSQGIGQWSLSSESRFSSSMSNQIELALSVGDTDGDDRGEIIVSSLDKSLPNPPVDIYMLEGTGQIAEQFLAGTTGPLGSDLSSDDMDGDGANEIVVTLHDEVNDKATVKMLRSNGFEMNSIDVAAPRSGLSVAVGQF
ncbi:MAG: hypothetical protein OEV42_12890 [Deltaproteobacteria bacterium]|nr:hypothetical protein [Deltaproteobacteria bacterium]